MIYSSRNDRMIQELSSQSDGWAKRLETLEKEMMIPTDSSNDPAVNRMYIRVVDTADSARSTRDSILSLYGHRSYYQIILDPREAPFAMALELQVDYARVSRIIEDHLEDDPQPAETASNAVDEGLDIHAYGSTKPANSSKGLHLVKGSFDYPCRAIAVTPFKCCTSELSFEQNDVLQVAAFSGPNWQVRNKKGQGGIVPCHYLTPHYPYLVIACRSWGKSILKGEILNVSATFTLGEQFGDFWPFPAWRSWRKKTGETGIAPDVYFRWIDKQL